MIELNLLAPADFADTLDEVRAAMDTARSPLAPDFYDHARAYTPLFELHHRMVDFAILNGWTDAVR